MGDHGPAATKAANQGTDGQNKSLVFDAFKDHCSAPKINTSLTLLESIRSIHADQHVTAVSPSNCDLLGFALAGNAEAQLVTADEGYQLRRQYIAPPGRSRSDEGKLKDSVTIGQYQYSWQGQIHPVYHFEWFDPSVGCERYHFILAPKADVDNKAHSASTDRLVTACAKWTAELHEEVYVFDSGCWMKNHNLWQAIQTATWDDVILDQKMKQTLVDDVHGFFDSRDVYAEYGVPWKRGIIFHGTPGCGKTISIKALMNSLQARDVVSLYVKSFDDKHRGPQHSIRSIFAQARDMAPCLLIFEDLDSLVKDEVRSYFLNEVDGLEDNDGILMIGSTNHLDRLDPGIAKRPSRFDRKYHYQLPGPQERILYAQYWQRKLAANKRIDFPDELGPIVAELTEGFSFAYMKELFVQALLAIVGSRIDVDADVSEDEEEDEEAVEKMAETLKVEEGESSTMLKEGESVVSTSNADWPKEERPVSRKRVPQAKIPDHLQSNPFLQILRKQVRVLMREMDNTNDGIAGRAKIPGEVMSAGRRPMRVIRAQVQAQAMR